MQAICRGSFLLFHFISFNRNTQCARNFICDSPVRRFASSTDARERVWCVDEKLRTFKERRWLVIHCEFTACVKLAVIQNVNKQQKFYSLHLNDTMRFDVLNKGPSLENSSKLFPTKYLRTNGLCSKCWNFLYSSGGEFVACWCCYPLPTRAGHILKFVTNIKNK
jgi:hypothetical protein